MSLTSYRAAPPRGNGLRFWRLPAATPAETRTAARLARAAVGVGCDKGGFLVLRRPGDDLLSQVLRHSTIGARAFDGRVRDGIGSDRSAKATRPAKHKKRSKLGFKDRVYIPASPDPKSTRLFGTMLCSSHHLIRKVRDFSGRCIGWALINESVQAERAISTGKLHALLRFHTRPIDVVVFHGSSGRTRFEAGFPLRCLQRLSVPYIATLHCGWRHNRSTRGTFTPVLSY